MVLGPEAMPTRHEWQVSTDDAKGSEGYDRQYNNRTPVTKGVCEWAGTCEG
jgi:hypothetical protein